MSEADALRPSVKTGSCSSSQISSRVAASRAAIFGRIASEHARTVHHVLEITRQDGLLSDNPTLERSIRNRFRSSSPLRPDHQ